MEIQSPASEMAAVRELQRGVTGIPIKSMCRLLGHIFDHKKRNAMIFTAGDIRLRALEPEDLEWLYAVENDEELWQWGYSNVPYSRYSLKTYIAELHHDIYADGELRLVIETGNEHSVSGCVDLTCFSPRHLRAEVGILLFPEHRGRGVATKVLEMLATYAHEHLYMHLLYAIVSQKNTKARCLFERAKFERMSLLEDWLRDKENGYVPAYLYGFRM